MATRLALKLCDYVVTEAGFGADLGAEKFFDIKCRMAGLEPAAAVVVATVRALKMHGGVAKGDLGKEDVAAVRTGCANLVRHLRNLKSFGVPVTVSINRFISDTDAELQAVKEAAEAEGVKAFVATHWADGSAGTTALAEHVAELCDSGKADFRPLYPDEMPLRDKVETIVRKVYGGDGISCDSAIEKRFEELQAEYGHFPVCMAKTQYSFSTDPDLKGAPSGFTVPIRELRVSNGAGFIVAVTGAIMTMPGLPRVPSANNIYLNEQGQVEGLF
jgi:formate--tetrahydrofolate ligase